MRLGTGFLHDQMAHMRWRTRLRYPTATGSGDGGGLTGADLDRTIEDLARRRPDLVFAR